MLTYLVCKFVKFDQPNVFNFFYELRRGNYNATLNRPDLLLIVNWWQQRHIYNANKHSKEHDFK